MLQSLKDNPLMVRLLAHTGPPTMKVTLWIMLGAMAFGAIVGMVSAVTTADITNIPLVAISSLCILGLTLPGSFLSMLYPAVTAVAAALITGRTVQSEDYTMVRLSLVTPAQIVIGHVSAALYQLRVVCALLIGLSFMTLFQLATSLLLYMFTDTSIIAGISADLYSAAGLTPIPIYITASASFFLGLSAVFRVGGYLLLASGLGVAFALGMRQREVPAMLAAGLVILIQVLDGVMTWLVTMVPILLTSLAPSGMTDMMAYALIANAAYAVITTIMLYLLAWILIRVAPRWA